jgi:hypothetical protein
MCQSIISVSNWGAFARTPCIGAGYCLCDAKSQCISISAARDDGGRIDVVSWPAAIDNKISRTRSAILTGGFRWLEARSHSARHRAREHSTACLVTVRMRAARRAPVLTG